MDNLKVGDVVQLKSGGPKMTVVSIEDDKVSVEWLDGTTKKNEKFLKTVLRKPNKPRLGRL